MQRRTASRRRNYNDNRRALFNKRNRPVFKLAGSKTLGKRVCDFLKFKCSLQSHGIPRMTPQEKERLSIMQLFCRFFDILILSVENMLNFRRNLDKRIENIRHLTALHSAFNLSQIQTENITGRNLRDKSLRRSNSNLRSGVRIQNRVRLARNRSSLRIAYGKNARTVLSRMPHCHKRVHRFARLRYRNNQSFAVHNRVAIPEFVSQFNLDRNAHPMLNRIFRDKTRIRSRSAGHNNYLVHRLENAFINVNFVKIKQTVFVNPAAQSVRHSRRLLVNFLIHKGRPAVFLGRACIPVDSVRLRFFDFTAVKIG